MKILALTSEFPPHRGGIGTYALNILTAAHELGADVVLGAPDYGLQAQASAESPFAALPFEVVRFRGGPHSFRDLGRKLAFVRRMSRGRAHDVLHAMDWPFFIPAALAGRGARRLHTLHGSEILDMAGPVKRGAIAAARVFAGDFSVVANSHYTEALFLRYFSGVARDRVRFVHLGTAAPQDRDAGDDAAAAPEITAPAGNFVILTVGRVVPRKGQLELVRAIGLLPEHHRSRLTVFIAGPLEDGRYVRAVRQAITDGAMDARVLGAVAPHVLDQLYAGADLFCLTGIETPKAVEGFGLVYLEAAAWRLPSVASDIGACKEVVIDGETGVIVPPEDAPALAAAIVALMENPERLQAMGRKAATRAAEMTWQRCAAATYGLQP